MSAKIPSSRSPVHPVPAPPPPPTPFAHVPPARTRRPWSRGQFPPLYQARDGCRHPQGREQGRHISYFGPEANDFGLLESFFQEYGQSGTGQYRRYLHSFDEAVPFNQMPGTFTPGRIRRARRTLFYEGVHGGVVTDEHNVARHVDFLIGVVPIVNLEWIQKLIRDTSERGPPGRR